MKPIVGHHRLRYEYNNPVEALRNLPLQTYSQTIIDFLSVSSKIVMLVAMPPCAQEGDDDTKDKVDDNYINKFVHKLDF